MPSCMTRLLFVPLALAALTAQAEVTEDFNTRYYDVKATAGKSLSEAVSAASSIAVAGKKFHGLTEWRVNWSWYHRYEADGRCFITSVKVALTGEMLLPRLSDATPTQSAEFERYLGALQEHENGHRRIGQEAARDIERILLALPQFPNCKQLETEAHARARARLDLHMERDKEYDRNTGHGRTQGAVLRD